MPTYTVTSFAGSLDDTKRAVIAREITRVHHEATGAPGYFAQVIFHEIQPGRYFIGGKPLSGAQVFVNGQIRSGRTEQAKDKLISEMLAAVASSAALPANNVWVYITDLLPRQMIEFGHVLPNSGDEEAWSAALPAVDRDYMQSFQAGAS